MDSEHVPQYSCRKISGVDYYREKPEDKNKPEGARRWELVDPAYAVVDVRAKLTLFVGTHTEAAQQMCIYEQTPANDMAALQEKIRNHLAEIGPQKETCRGTHSEASGQRWRGLRPQK